MAGTRSDEGHTDSDLSLEIDASVLQEAVASVARNLRQKTPKAVPAGEVLIDLETDAPDLAQRADLLDPDSADAPDPTRSRAARAAPVTPPAPGQAGSQGVEFSAEERQRWLVRQLEQTERIKQLQKELRQVRHERDELKGQAEKLQHTLDERLAEFESSRQRQRKDREEAERVAEERAIRPFLEVVDNLERAFAHASKETERESGGDPAKILNGLKMILDQYNKLLRRAGAERVAAERGGAFDPEVHEAILHMAAPGMAAGVIVEEVSAGFRLKGRLLRPARVVVSAG